MNVQLIKVGQNALPWSFYNSNFLRSKALLCTLLCIPLLFWGQPLLAQHVITGKVVDEKNESLPGALVLVKGTQTGSVTMADGTFQLDAAVPNPTLIVEFIGFQSTEISVNTNDFVTIQLESKEGLLDEVVVIGYGTQRKSDLTGAVGSVTEEELGERPAANVNMAIAGKVPGVQVNVNSGRPGGQTNVRVRGFSSINTSNAPLYVVDGIITNAIDFINPNDIASVEVLKDASSTAIYGARGANGVILITTKRGRLGTANITYTSEYFTTTMGPNRVQNLNAREFLAIQDLSYANIQKYDPEGWAAGSYDFVDPALSRTDPRLFDADGNPIYDTDWQKEMSQTKLSQNHQLGVSGGSDKSNYGIFVGYRDENGLMLNSYLKRYSARFTSDNQIKSWLKVGGSLSYNSQEENILSDGAFRQQTEAFPMLPVKFPDGTWGDNRSIPEIGNYDANPVHIATEQINIVETHVMLGNIYSNIDFTKDLQLRTVFGANIVNSATKFSQSRSLAVADQGNASTASSRENFWSLESYLTYNRRFHNDHSLNALLGISWQESDYFGQNVGISNFSSDYFLYNNIGAGSTNPRYGSDARRYAFNSYFSRLNYTYKDKYLFTFTARVDGSSKFGENHKYALFPSGAFAWRAIEEDFLKNQDVISNLKLRASYGITGNSEIPPYSSLGVLSSTYAGILNNQRIGGTGLGRLNNPDLKWEKTAQSDLGIELGLFSNRINLEADIYYRKTTDMLLDAPVPRTSAFATIRRNVGSMENKGVEIGINTVNIDNTDFGWTSTFNIAANKNKVLSLSTPGDIFGVGGPDFVNPNNIIRVGEPVGSFWGLTRLGVWSEAELEEAASFTSYRSGLPILPGDIKYLDLNGDNAITEADRHIIGNGNPKAYGTLLNTFRYKSMELTIDLQYSYGNDVLDMSTLTGEDRVVITGGYKSLLDAWTPSNQGSVIPEIREFRAGYVSNVDTRWLQDGSFIRGRNILLAYTFNIDVLERLNINTLRIYTSVQNAFLITKFRQGDPEVTSYGHPFAQGQIFYPYPKPTTFLIGLNIGL